MLRRRLRNQSDEALLSLTAAGDELALGELYDRFGRVTYGLAFRVVHNTSLAEQAVQDAFLAVWRSEERFDGAREGVRAWLLELAHRKALDIQPAQELRTQPSRAGEPQLVFAEGGESSGVPSSYSGV